MHIAEGVLSPPVLFGGMALTLGLAARGIRLLRTEDVPRVGIVAAGLFVASLIHIPVGPTSVHLVLNGIGGIVLGWQIFPATLVALVLQGLLFQFGGMVVLGVNVLDMALPGFIFGMLFRRFFLHSRAGLFGGAAFFCCFMALLGGAFLTALALALSGEVFGGAAKLIVVAHVPVALVEGIVGAGILLFLRRVRPEILEDEA
jgi:cobalt/nickel transport system permease protein